jgi:hypothetical protein
LKIRLISRYIFGRGFVQQLFFTGQRRTLWSAISSQLFARPANRHFAGDKTGVRLRALGCLRLSKGTLCREEKGEQKHKEKKPIHNRNKIFD